MTFHVPTISCGHCKAAIETAIRDAGGTADVDLAAKTVAVAGLDSTVARAAIEAAGFEVQAA